MSTRSKIVLAVVTLLLVGGIAAVIAVRVAGPGPEVETATVQEEDLAVTVTAAGEIEAGVSSDVYPPTQGTLESVEVTEGQKVKSGAVLARMDTTPLEAAVLQARSALAQAEAQRSSIDNQAPSSAEIEAARATTDAAWSQYCAAVAALDAFDGAGTTSSELAAADAAAEAAYALYKSALTDYESLKEALEASAAPSPGMQAALALAELAVQQTRSQYLTAAAQAEALRAGPEASQRSQLEAAVDQSYAAYLGALAQQRKLEGTSLSAERNAAETGIEQAREALAVAEENLRKATLRAPVDGVVIFNPIGAPNSVEGEAPKPEDGAAVGPQAAPFTVVDLERVRFTAEVDEVDVNPIEVGLDAIVDLDAFPGKSFEATVSAVMPQAMPTPTGGTIFPVHLTFKEDAKDILLGMKGDAEIEVSSVPGAITIPIEALFDEGGTTYVYVVEEDETLSRTRVEVGTLTETRAQITQGLQAGDVVALSGTTELVDGMKVSRAE